MKALKLISIMILSGILYSCATEFRDQKPDKFETKSNIYKILYFASLAGSSHNSQPWKVEVVGNRLIKLYADTTRELSVVDPQRKELYISLGAFIENLTLAAGSYGYQTVIILNSANSTNNPVAEITLNKATTTVYDLSQIEKRRTIRTPFKTISIKESDIKQILALDPLSIRFFSASSDEGKFVAQKTIEAYTQQALNKDAQSELAKWIRFSDKDVKEKKDGLTTEGMQIEGISGFYVRHFLNPEDSKKRSFIKGGIEKTKKQAFGCGGWIIISSNGNSVVDWINTGRLYQHIHLICTQLKIGFQPMNQILEEEKFKKEVVSQLKINKEFQFVVRIGYVDKIKAPVSPRRPIEDFSHFNQ